MSNILKKITKKYKWLRFLNYKTTKLAVLSAALFGLCLSSGASFAKYRDENYGNGNAGTAKFSNGIIEYVEKTYSLANVSEEKDNLGTYAFAANFSIDFSQSEVALDYILKIKFANSFNSIWDDNDPMFNFDGKVSFVWDKAYSLYTLEENDGKFTSSNDFNKILGTNISSNTTYISKNNSWLSSSDYSYGNEIITINGSVDGNKLSNKEEYKIIFFVDIILNDDIGKVEAPDIYFIFDLETIQKGGEI